MNEKNSRFPAYWTSPWETVPDQDGGCVLMIALQAMLMQTDEGKIFLAPCWPKDWDVEFKLNAPMQTVVDGKIENNKLQKNFIFLKQ